VVNRTGEKVEGGECAEYEEVNFEGYSSGVPKKENGGYYKR